MAQVRSMPLAIPAVPLAARSERLMDATLVLASMLHERS
jgi:hypothetical protein